MGKVGRVGRRGSLGRSHSVCWEVLGRRMGIWVVVFGGVGGLKVGVGEMGVEVGLLVVVVVVVVVVGWHQWERRVDGVFFCYGSFG